VDPSQEFDSGLVIGGTSLDDDQLAHFLSSSFDLVFVQEIPPGDSGQYRLRQLVRSMNTGSPLNEPRFAYLLGRETVVTDTTSQLNAIVYPTSWKVLHHTSLTSFLHPPIMAWFKPAESSSTTILAASFHISPSVGLASSSSASQEPGIPSTRASPPPQPARPRFRTVSTSSYQRLWRQLMTGRSPCLPFLIRGTSPLGGSLVGI